MLAVNFEVLSEYDFFRSVFDGGTPISAVGGAVFKVVLIFVT